LLPIWNEAGEEGDDNIRARKTVFNVLNRLRAVVPAEATRFLLDLYLLEKGIQSPTFDPAPPLKRKDWRRSFSLPPTMGGLLICWAEAEEKNGSPIGISEAVERTCLALGVDYRTPFRWLNSLNEGKKAEIVERVRHWKAGRLSAEEEWYFEGLQTFGAQFGLSHAKGFDEAAKDLYSILKGPRM
jgi:hypothetical protein